MMEELEEDVLDEIEVDTKVEKESMVSSMFVFSVLVGDFCISTEKAQ